MSRKVNQTAIQRYDANENIVYVSFPNVYLETQDDIRGHFDRILEFWERECKGKKVYYVVNYDGISISFRENQFYATQMKRVIDCAITIVRYGGDPLQRTAARLVNMRLHSPSHLYESREEALAVVRALKKGEMSLDDQR